MRIFARSMVLILLPASLVMGQSVTLNGSFRDFVTFYVSSIDLATLESEVEIFDYKLSASEYPVEVQITFDILISSPALGLSFNQPFAHIVTTNFELKGPIQIRSTDLKNPPDPIYYTEGDFIGSSVDFSINEISTILEDPDFNSDAMINQVMQSGRLPDGEYRFDLSVSVTGGTGASISESIFVSNPVSLELISPGGSLADIDNNVVRASNPTFYWQSDPCDLCKFQIRVAQFKPDEHSSVEDAIEDQTVLPLRQADEFYSLASNSPSFQYPFSDATDLLPGALYAWQIKKIIPTTAGDRDILSPIYAFKMEGACPEPMIAALSIPVLGFLLATLGEDQYLALFKIGGDLYDYCIPDGITLNGASAEISDLTDISASLVTNDSISISVEVE